MLCSKIGGQCPHPVQIDPRFVFVIMPFKGFDNIYDAIQQAVEGIDDKEFVCKRADDEYTNLSIWCQNICKNIRRAKYLIVDTTGKNPNVFYELGFAHALDETKAILITQNIKEAPFDIADLNHIVYDKENLKDLRRELQKAIMSLEKEPEPLILTRKSSEELIRELKQQVRDEEKRSDKFKEQLLESEKREEELKQNIREIEAIQANPVKEAKEKIAKLEGTIAELKSTIKLTEAGKEELIGELKKKLNEKEEKLQLLQKEYDFSQGSKDDKSLSDLLLTDPINKAEAQKWFKKALTEQEKGNYSQAIKYYTKAVQLDPESFKAYNNRGITYKKLREYEKALEDYNRAIELNPFSAFAYNNRGVTYNRLMRHEKAFEDFKRAIELDSGDVSAHLNLAELCIISGDYVKACETLAGIPRETLSDKHLAACLYLEGIARMMLDRDMEDWCKLFDEVMGRDFETAWNFEIIEEWLSGADIPIEKKAFVLKITEQFKKHLR